jgi:hypothetical protein
LEDKLFRKAGNRVYLLFWSSSLLLDPDPLFQYGTDPDLESQINANPDPQLWSAHVTVIFSVVRNSVEGKKAREK